MTAPASEPHLVESLTERQRLVLSLIAKGYTNPQIATELGVTIDGAKWHVREILSKLSVDSREDAARWWREQQRPHRRLQRALQGLATVAVLRWAGATAALAAGFVVLAFVVQAIGSRAEEHAASPTRAATAAPGEEPSATPSATPAGGAGFQRHDYAPGETLTRPGIYFVDTATGAIEGWSVDAPGTEFHIYFPSPDNRVILAYHPAARSPGNQAHRSDQAFVLDRVSGEQWQFDIDEWEPLRTSLDGWIALVGANPGGTVPSRTLVRLVHLPTRETRDLVLDRASVGGVVDGRFSPDGGHLVLVGRRSLVRLDVRSGDYEVLLENTDVWFEEAPTGAGLFVRAGSAMWFLPWGGRPRVLLCRLGDIEPGACSRYFRLPGWDAGCAGPRNRTGVRAYGRVAGPFVHRGC